MKAGYAVRTGLLALALVFGGGLLVASSNTAFAGEECAAYAFSGASQDAGVTFHPAHHGSAHTVTAAPVSESLGWAYEWSGASPDAGVVLAGETAGRTVKEVYEGHPAGDEADMSSGRRAAENRHPSGLTREEAHSLLSGWFE